MKFYLCLGTSTSLRPCKLDHAWPIPTENTFNSEVAVHNKTFELAITLLGVVGVTHSPQDICSAGHIARAKHREQN